MPTAPVFYDSILSGPETVSFHARDAAFCRRVITIVTRFVICADTSALTVLVDLRAVIRHCLTFEYQSIYLSECN